MVDPVIAQPTGAETETLNIKGRIGPDAVSVAQMYSPEDYIKKPDAPVAKKQWTADNMNLPAERVEIKDPMVNRRRTTFYSQ